MLYISCDEIEKTCFGAIDWDIAFKDIPPIRDIPVFLYKFQNDKKIKFISKRMEMVVSQISNEEYNEFCTENCY